MKMMVQKPCFKKVILLLLLLVGGINFSFSVEAAVPEEEQELIITAEYNEQLQDIQEGFRPVINSLRFFRLLSDSALPPYQYLSISESERTAKYLQNCQLIEPALGRTEIIYPFHFFL